MGKARSHMHTHTQYACRELSAANVWLGGEGVGVGCGPCGKLLTKAMPNHRLLAFCMMTVILFASMRLNSISINLDS